MTSPLSPRISPRAAESSEHLPSLDLDCGQKVGLRFKYLCGAFSYPITFLRLHVSDTALIISAWFMVNLAITIYNKATFQFAHFNYPMLTTAVHLTFTLLGVLICQHAGFVERGQTPGWDMNYFKLVMFSLLFTANIWLSNWSVMVASLPLNQIMRASVPLFTVAINFLIFREQINPKIIMPIFVVIIGCALTVSGEATTTTLGLCIVLISCAASSLKGVATQKTQVSQGLGAFDVLRFMCPLALVELLIGSLITGEIQDLAEKPELYYSKTLWLIMSGAGVLAFTMNVVSFRAVVLSDPLTMNIFGNLKQVLTSFIAIPLFGSPGSLSLFLGILVACVGSYWYGKEAAEYKMLMKAKQHEEANQLNSIEMRQESDGHARDEISKEHPDASLHKVTSVEN